MRPESPKFVEMRFRPVTAWEHTALIQGKVGKGGKERKRKTEKYRDQRERKERGWCDLGGKIVFLMSRGMDSLHKTSDVDAGKYLLLYGPASIAVLLSPDVSVVVGVERCGAGGR